MPSNSAARVLLFFAFLLQGAHDHLSLDLFERRAHRQRRRVFVAQTFALFDWIRSEVMAFDLFAGTDEYRTFDHVAEFADIARPGMKLKRFESVAQKTCGTSVLFGELRTRCCASSGKSSFRSRSGKLNAEDVETVEQIAAEFAFGNGLLWMTIGGGEQAHVNFDLFAAAETSYRASSITRKSRL